MNKGVKRALFSVVVVAGFLLSACAQDIEGNPDYNTGYSVGCRAGADGRPLVYQYQKRTKKDKQLFEDSAAYRSGWRAGMMSCRTNSGRTGSFDPKTITPYQGASRS